MWISEDCTNYGNCIEACKIDAINQFSQPRIDEDKCIDCGECRDVCPIGCYN